MVDLPSAADVKKRLVNAADAVKTAAVQVGEVVAEEARQMRADQSDSRALKADAKRAATRVRTVVRKAAKKVAKVAAPKRKATATKAAKPKAKRPAKKAARKTAKKKR